MPRILLADDHNLVRQALAQTLQTAGHTIVGQVADGLAVADAVERELPDLLLLDMALPGLHGLDVIREVQRRTPAVRVLVLSGDGREEFVIGALKNGAVGYVIKGADLLELLTAVSYVMQGGRYVSPTLSDHLVRALLERSETYDSYDSLTFREREVFHLMAEGLSVAQTAARLAISDRTVESHRSSVMKKLALTTQVDVVRFAMRRGLLPDG